jgi:RNA polymerase sigma factor (sigma-70 family)
MSPSVSTRLLLTQSDARLVKLAHEGHERAFEALVQRYRRQLLAYCRRLLLPSERAEDALQQGLLQAWLALQQGVDVKDARPWLYKIVHNAALNMLRVSGYDYATLSETLQGADAPEDDLDRRIAVREAFAGLAALPQMQREALLRTALDGHSHEHVAHALGLSEGALRGLVYRARATLRAAATALTPPPTLSWALNHRVTGAAPLASRVAELAAGSGSVGVGGLLLKGGAVVVTAGALASGIAAQHRHADRRGADKPFGQASARSPALPPASLELLSAAQPTSRGQGPHRGALQSRRHPVLVVLGGRPAISPSRPRRHTPLNDLAPLGGDRRGDGRSQGDGQAETLKSSSGDRERSGSKDGGSSGGGDLSGSGGGDTGSKSSDSSSSGSGAGSGSGGSDPGAGGSGSSSGGSGGSGDKTSGDGGSTEEASSSGDASTSSGDSGSSGSLTEPLGEEASGVKDGSSSSGTAGGG